jgi:hypothetical protein
LNDVAGVGVVADKAVRERVELGEGVDDESLERGRVTPLGELDQLLEVAAGAGERRRIGTGRRGRAPQRVSLWRVCLRSKRQNFCISMRSRSFCLFLVVM